MHVQVNENHPGEMQIHGENSKAAVSAASLLGSDSRYLHHRVTSIVLLYVPELDVN